MRTPPPHLVVYRSPNGPTGDNLIRDDHALLNQILACRKEPAVERSSESQHRASEPVRVLLVAADPYPGNLRLQSEQRLISQGLGKDVDLTVLPAATVNDLCRALMHGAYDIVQFSGHTESLRHATRYCLDAFEQEHGAEARAELQADAPAMGRVHDAARALLAYLGPEARPVERPPQHTLQHIEHDAFHSVLWLSQ